MECWEESGEYVLNGIIVGMLAVIECFFFLALTFLCVAVASAEYTYRPRMAFSLIPSAGIVMSVIVFILENYGWGIFSVIMTLFSLSMTFVFQDDLPKPKSEGSIKRVSVKYALISIAIQIIFVSAAIGFFTYLRY
jgi:hypothetical protein